MGDLLLRMCVCFCRCVGGRVGALSNISRHGVRDGNVLVYVYVYA